MTPLRFGLLFTLPLLSLGCASSPAPADCSETGCELDELCLDGRCQPRVFVDASVDGGLEEDARVDGGPTRPAPLPSGECQLEAVPEPFQNPQRELHWLAEGLPFAAMTHGVTSPVVIDLIAEAPDEDMVPEIIFPSYAEYGTGGPLGVLRVVRGRAPYETVMTLPGDDGPPLGPEESDYGRSAQLMGDAHPAAGDLDGDGRPEIVAVAFGGGLVAFHHDGTIYWRANETALARSEGGTTSAVSIADLDQDGAPEVVVGRTAINGQTGERLWHGRAGLGDNAQGPLSCVADIVPDSPGMEVIAGQTVYSATGTALWGSASGFCAVADVTLADGTWGADGLPEVIAVSAGTVNVLDGATGERRWTRRLPACGSEAGRGGAPTVADYDGDGLAEIGVAGATCYAVLDGGCQAGDEGCQGEGLLWKLQVYDTSSNVTSSTVFDFNGDGAAEVVYADERFLRVIEGRTGTQIFAEGNPSRTRTEQPIVADVDNDGNAEILLLSNTEHSIVNNVPAADRTPGLEIWSSADDAWVAARPIWNQHTYHISNVELDGTIPTVESASWSSHNSYRLNAAYGDLLAGPDLAGGLHGPGECVDGALPVCLEVGNRGEIQVGPGVVVRFYAGDELIGEASTTQTLERDDFEEVCIDWVDAPTVGTEVHAEIDPSGAERECDEENNTVELGWLYCDGII